MHRTALRHDAVPDRAGHHFAELSFYFGQPDERAAEVDHQPDGNRERGRNLAADGMYFEAIGNGQLLVVIFNVSIT